MINGAPAAVRLMAVRYGAPELAPDARSSAWRDTLGSTVVIMGGLSLLVKALAANNYWWLGDLALSIALVLPSMLRHRPADGEPGHDLTGGSSRPSVSASPERPRGPELPPPTAGASARQLADWVERKRFATTRLRPGYDEEDVDILLNKIRDTFLGLESVTRQEVRSAHFTRTHLRPGYVEEDVDTFLAAVGERLP
jgi:DivIVA domain-containing protein